MQFSKSTNNFAWLRESLEAFTGAVEELRPDFLLKNSKNHDLNIRALQKNETFLREFLKSNEAIKLLVHPSDGNIVDSNFMACAFLGCSREELHVKKISLFSFFSAQILEKWTSKAKDNWIRAGVPAQCLSGKEFKGADVYAGPVYFDEQSFLLFIIQPPVQAVDQQKVQDEAGMIDQGLNEFKCGPGADGEFGVLLDNIPIQIWNYVNPFTYGLANKAHADFMGLKKKDLNNARIVDVIPGKLAEQIIEENVEIFTRKNKLQVSRWFLNHKGEGRFLSIIKKPLLNSRGEVVSVVCSANDVTDNRIREDNLRGKLDVLRSKTMIDVPTGLFNRSYFDEVLKREWGRSRRDGKHLSLIIVDIDCFKLFNDNYGHPAGDKCLRLVCEALSGVVTRTTDIVARYGGEEFAAILPQTNARGAVQIAEKMRVRVEDMQIRHEFSPAAKVVTVSAGVATIPPISGLKDFSREDFVNAADQALYEAKKGGKNQIRNKVLKYNEEQVMHNLVLGAMGKY